MKMKAAVLRTQGLGTPYAQSRPFEVTEVTLDPPGEGEVLVEVRAAGVCHSDLSMVSGLRKRAVPVVGGHEGAGVIVEIGPGVHGLAPGDHVVLSTAGGCGHCRQCIAGRPTICENTSANKALGRLPNGATRLADLDGSPLCHYTGISCFAEYAVVLPSGLVKIDEDIPFEIAALFGCAVVTGVGVTLNAGRVGAGHKVAVFGLGGVGLNAVMAAKLAGASKVIGVDVSERKLTLGEELGCTHTILAQDPELIAKVHELTGGGVDVSFEMSGVKAAFASALGVLRRGGELICVGLSSSDARFELPHNELVVQEKSVRGSVLGSAVQERDIPLYVQFFRDGQLPVDRLVSGTLPLEDINSAFDDLAGGGVLRQVLLPHAGERLEPSGAGASHVGV